MLKILKYVILLLLMLAVLIWKQWPDDNLHLVFCDVGQGDAILITHGFWQTLVDTGPDEAVNACLSQHLPFWDRQLEQIIITHWDQDHCGGLDSVVAQYGYDYLWYSQHPTTADSAKQWSELKTDSDISHNFILAFLDRLTSTDFGLQGRVLWPMLEAIPQEVKHLPNSKIAKKTPFSETGLSDVNHDFFAQFDNQNDRSIVLEFNYGQFDFLLTGDVSQPVELALIERGLIKNIDVLKVGHHGAKTSTNPSFLGYCRPEISVVSCGQNNRYQHPAEETMSHLHAVSSKVLRTDQLGTVEVVTDGSQYWIND